MPVDPLTCQGSNSPTNAWQPSYAKRPYRPIMGRAHPGANTRHRPSSCRKKNSSKDPAARDDSLRMQR
jgi:hypothetical protein